MSDWTPPAHWSPEEVEGWKQLDHSHCTQYAIAGDAIDTPGYARCRSMHCGACGKSTSSQGHMKKVGDEWVCPTPEELRTPWP